jgi:acyl-coenzyme A thioesterase PaaI-like protein
MATLDLRIDYLKPAPKGATVYARCQCYKLTRSVAFVRGTAHLGDINDPIAQSALTFMTTS